MLNIIKDLTPLNRVFCSNDYDKSIEYLLNHLPFKVIELTKQDEANGWVIPPKWDVKKAIIKRNGEIVFDGTKHVLNVIGLSTSFNGIAALDELKKHLYYHPKYDDAIPYHYSQSYTSWQRDWGFCVTKNFYDSLKSGEYEVTIETEESEGTLKICEYTHKGELEETFVFVAHLDHPGMANDDLAGCAVGIELFKRLPKTKYTYKLLLVQEIIGSELYLNKYGTENIIEGIFLEMLGSKTPLILQKSVNGDSYIESLLDINRGEFGRVVGNDEVVWEAHGVPMCSISRFPYPEYHTDKDNASIISEESLEESVKLLLKTIEKLEQTKLVIKKFTGYPCLSNPQYDLYIGANDRLRNLMEFMPMLPKVITVNQLAKKFNLSEEEILEYLNKWIDKGLIEIK
jgi:aminopeptidase-like protein